MVDTAAFPVKSALRTLDIIEYVVARDRPVVAQEVAAALTIPVSSLSYLLTTLVDRGYLARAGRRYTPGPGLARLQTRASGMALAERVAPLVRALRLQLNETTSFFIRKGWEVEALVTETSEHALRYAVQMGTSTALHGFAAGKAILATLPDSELEAYLTETERVAFTPATITAAAELRREIAEIRRTGIARTREEHTPGIQGIARAVMVGGAALGAFSVAIPSVRFDATVEDNVAELLRRTALLLETE
ncbi:IclR family transcriptional regulator [Sphingomonas sp. AR_OL41]|uniref:IclR family transcriptional regulator n=1 Tax=Parasphingomonas halimpatiens TaxID=3096162 RepID=UPI002480262D|nr:IclR family transcriptional regulator [Sphingomonas sp. AR_OL41]MDH7971507.1 IclR family transcriptional regulator [Sphingomonas sp. AR_OL41]